MLRIASPIECAPVEHAETCEKLAPRAPVRIESTPGIMLMMMSVTKYGLNPYRGPLARPLSCVASIVETPPRPAPKYTPQRSSSPAGTLFPG